MNILEIIRFAIRGLNTNKLRTTLTTLGIAIGVSSVIILIAEMARASRFNPALIDSEQTQ